MNVTYNLIDMVNAASHQVIRNCGLCGKEFVALRYNTRYCSPVCQKKENNNKALAAYYKNKEIKSGILSGKIQRRCKNPECNIILSRYNKEKYCGPCARKNFITRLVADGFDPEYAEHHWLIN